LEQKVTPGVSKSGTTADYLIERLVDPVAQRIGPLMPALVPKDIKLDANGTHKRFVGLYFRRGVKSITLSGRDKD
jgi:hypothetical protein